MTVTVSSTDYYTIIVNNDTSGTAALRIRRPTGMSYEDVTRVPGAPGTGETAGALEWVSTRAELRRSGGVIFHAPSGADLAEFATTGPTVTATLDSIGALVLSGGSLRFPIVTSLPGSPAEGECLIYKNNGSGWARLGVYLNSGWRYSANL